jgi:hypothetical protein
MGKKQQSALILFVTILFLNVSVPKSTADVVAVSINSSNPYRDFLLSRDTSVFGGSYEILVDEGDEDPVVQLYSGAAAGVFKRMSDTPSSNFLAEDNDGGPGLSAALIGSLPDGDYVIRVTTSAYWQMGFTPDGNFSLEYVGFVTRSSAANQQGAQTQNVRKTTNLSFGNSLYGTDMLADPDGELRKTVDSINSNFGSLIK